MVPASVVVTDHSSLAAPARSDAGATAIARADRALQQRRVDIRASGDDAYKMYRSIVDRNGSAHVRYTRTYRGLRVYGGDFVVHTGPTGAVTGASVGLLSPLALETTAKVDAAATAKTARERFAGKVTSVGTPELFVDASRGTGRLAWETVVVGWARDGQTPSRLHVISDAVTGAHIGAFDEIENIAGSGNGITTGAVTIDTSASAALAFVMTDPSHGYGYTCDMLNGTSTCVDIYDADNVWGNGSNGDRASAAVDAHYGAAKTFDYFRNVHGRDGIFGNGRGVPSRVHYGSNYANAFWNGSSMTYGDNAGNARPLVSLDVAGHEMSHGVTANVVPGGLTYSGESGGLNEATSDIFGTMVEFFAGNATDAPDYLIGEKINYFGDGRPLRYMYNPALDGVSDSCWSTSTAGKDVHHSSGVGNHFFYNLAEGTGNLPYGTSPVCGSAIGAPGIGRAKAEKIWFRALDSYFTSTTSYVNTANPGNTARAYTLQAATDLFGFCSLEYRAVQRAWWAVNVAGSDAFCQVTLGSPGTVTTVRGTNASLFPDVSGGYFTYTYTASGYPTGMQFEPLLGIFYGTATVGGTYFPTLTVTDSLGQTASVTFTWIVDVRVPDLRGLNLTAAKTALQAGQLTLGTVSSRPDPLCEYIGKVMSQSPSRGTQVRVNTAVNVTLGTRPSICL
jgi:Zn-dependent metalloprotease